MTSIRILPAALALTLAALGFVGFQPEAEAACDVNLGGYCAGTCQVNALATCWQNGSCRVNVVATCGSSWDPYAYGSCYVNAAQADCTGSCFANVGDASCTAWGSCFANAGSADCAGWCAANAGSASCNGGCLTNVGGSTCDSTTCASGTGTGGVEPICFLWGCTVNAAFADCHPEGRCSVNVASDCSGGCGVNLASFATPLAGSAIIWLGCGETGACTVNVASRCDGYCTVNAVLATCEQDASCLANVFATCSVLRELLP